MPFSKLNTFVQCYWYASDFPLIYSNGIQDNYWQYDFRRTMVIRISDFDVNQICSDKWFSLSLVEDFLGFTYYPRSDEGIYYNNIMMTSANGNIFRVTGPLCGEFTGQFPAKRPVTRSLMFYLIWAWINGWVNNRKAGDLRGHRAHYDVTVMYQDHDSVTLSEAVRPDHVVNTMSQFIFSLNDNILFLHIPDWRYTSARSRRRP